MLRNAAKFAITSGIGHMFTFIGELFIAFITTLIGHSILTQVSYYEERLHSPVVPTVLIFLLSWIVGSSFMSVYGITADTILHCYCMDEEMNSDAVNAKKSLKDFMKVHVQERQGLLSSMH